LNQTHKTAISRTHLSTPTKWLKDNNLLVGEVLDYGCGRGYDAETLHIEKFDPHFFPTVLKQEFYDTIICIYVLNVLKGTEQATVIKQIKKLLKSGGKAYFAVRRDIPKSGTKTQYWVELNAKSVHKTGWFEIYEVEK
jgi:2-polyprenyl-3-methyl-5-hydroxy-6-metoxy-1,4-benzoquinol methylase